MIFGADSRKFTPSKVSGYTVMLMVIMVIMVMVIIMVANNKSQILFSQNLQPSKILYYKNNDSILSGSIR